MGSKAHQGHAKEPVSVCKFQALLTYVFAFFEQLLDLSQSVEISTSFVEFGGRQLFISQTFQDEGPYTQGLEVGKLFAQSSRE